jgi:hypothetical protein
VVCGVGLDRLDSGIVGSNTAYDMRVCSRLSVLWLSCVGRGLPYNKIVCSRSVRCCYDDADDDDHVSGGAGSDKNCSFSL